MKKLLILITPFIFCLGTSVSIVWSIVEFILYLVKDKPFNWWSLWSILICGFMMIFTFIVSAIIEIKQTKGDINFNLPNNKSKFQERLKEIQLSRKNG